MTLPPPPRRVLTVMVLLSVGIASYADYASRGSTPFHANATASELDGRAPTDFVRALMACSSLFSITALGRNVELNPRSMDVPPTLMLRLQELEANYRVAITRMEHRRAVLLELRGIAGDVLLAFASNGLCNRQEVAALSERITAEYERHVAASEN